MDTINSEAGRPEHDETEAEAEEKARLAWEAEGIADVAAGKLVDAAKVREWVDSLRTDNPLPVPYPGR